MCPLVYFIYMKTVEKIFAGIGVIEMCIIAKNKNTEGKYVVEIT